MNLRQIDLTILKTKKNQSTVILRSCHFCRFVCCLSSLQRHGRFSLYRMNVYIVYVLKKTSGQIFNSFGSTDHVLIVNELRSKQFKQEVGEEQSYGQKGK